MQFTMLALALGVVAVAAEPVQQDNEFAAMITSTPKLPRHLVAIRQQDEDAEGCDYVELSDGELGSLFIAKVIAVLGTISTNKDCEN
jgi:hypothetical protein